MVVGAYAVFVHGEPRFSKDVDVALYLHPADHDRVRELLQGSELHSFSWAEDPLWGRRFRCFDRDGVLVELFFTVGSVLQEREFQRRVRRNIDGQDIWFISAEDLVLRKLVNCRIRRGVDFDDAVSVVRMQGKKFDDAYIRQHCPVHRVCHLFDRVLIEAGRQE